MISLFLILFFAYMSIYDCLKLEVRNVDLILLFVLEVLYLFSHQQIKEICFSLLFAFLVFSLFFVFHLLFRESFGGGDVKVIGLLTMLYNLRIVYILFLSSFLGIVFFLISKKNIVPFIPFLFLGIILFEFIKLFIN